MGILDYPDGLLSSQSEGQGGQSQRRLEPEVVSDAGRGQEGAKDAGGSRNGKVKEIDLPWGLRRNQS